MTGRIRKGTVLLVLVLIVINLPAGTSLWREWQVARSGIDVTAKVAEHPDPDAASGHYLAFVLPDDLGFEERAWSVQLEDDAYAAAQQSGTVQVRVLESDATAFSVEGQVHSRLGLLVSLLISLLVVALAVVLSRFRGHLRAELQLRATTDLTAGGPESVLERQPDGFHVVCGEVVAREGDEVVLDLVERRVRVLLDGHANPVPLGARARAVGPLIA